MRGFLLPDAQACPMISIGVQQKVSEVVSNAVAWTMRYSHAYRCKLRALKLREKVCRIADANGPCIEVRPTGAKLWCYRYRYAGKPSMAFFVNTLMDERLVAARGSRAAYSTEVE
jgi:hypothetical protein